ncbi:MAG: Pvc16 family protein [Anaerolineae bacterium]
MIDDLDETLKQLLIQKAGLDPSEVDISFEIPTRDWATSSAATRPTVNLYLFDMRENAKLREMYWDADAQLNEKGQVQLKRRPVRMDLSYMVTCWTTAAEDQHRLLWRVLETLFRYSPLPDEVLQGVLKQSLYPVRTEMAQPDGILKNISDFWGALENQLRPCINLTVTLELDLNQVKTTSLVFAHGVKFGLPETVQDDQHHERLVPHLQPGYEIAPFHVGGIVRDSARKPLAGIAVRLIGTQPDGQTYQVGATVHTDANGHYVLHSVQPGKYTLVAEISGQAPHQQPLHVYTDGKGGTPPDLTKEVEVIMP